MPGGWKVEFGGAWWGSSVTSLRPLELGISLNKAIRFSPTLANTAGDLYHLRLSHSYHRRYSRGGTLVFKPVACLSGGNSPRSLPP